MTTTSHIVSEELRSTLGYFDQSAKPASATRKGGAGPRAPTRSSVRRRHFFVSSSNDTPLLQPEAIELLASQLDIDASYLLSVSRIPARTFQRRQAEGKPLSETETDRVLRIARVASLAQGVFGDAEKSRRWLSKDNRMLGAKPLDLLSTDQGTHEVEAELNRIEMGDFA